MIRSPDARAEPTRAAVLVPVRRQGAETSVILTERAAHLSMHAGQIAFPGGRHDPLRDASLVATALRETFEEIGLAETDLDVIGALSERRTLSSNHIVTPFVAEVRSAVSLRLDRREVYDTFDAPLQAFVVREGRERFVWTHEGRSYEVPLVAVGKWRVWGVTLQIIDELVAQLDAFFAS